MPDAFRGLLTRESGAGNVPAITRLARTHGEYRREKEVQISEREERGTTQGVEYENVGEEYLEHRKLQKGAAGWVLLAGLGVAYVISGEIGGWQFGLAEGGWGGLLIATILTAIMYTAMVYSLAELSAAIPVAGAGYGFTRRAMGVWGGFLTGTAIVIEVAIARLP